MNKSAYQPHHIEQNQIRPLNDSVIVSDMEFGERFTNSGIYLPSDNGKGTGIRPRWGQVYAVGPKQLTVSVGQWIMVEHGRWTRGIEIENSQGRKTIRRVDPKDILLVTDERPDDETMSDAVHIDQKTR